MDSIVFRVELTAAGADTEILYPSLSALRHIFYGECGINRLACQDGVEDKVLPKYNIFRTKMEGDFDE